LSGQQEESTRPGRPEWLGEPYEHGGEYRPSRAPGRIADAGCCLFEAAGAIGALAFVVVLLN
jgi:hypothetical protein